MKTFKEYLAEESGEFDSGNIGHQDLSKHLLPSEIKSIRNHPFYSEYVGNYVPGGSTVAYRVTKDRNGFKKVYAGNSGVLDTKYGKIRRMVQFDMKYSGRSVDNAHLLHNVDDARHTFGNKNIKWDHIKSHKNYENSK